MVKKRGLGFSREEFIHHTREIGSGQRQSFERAQKESKAYQATYKKEYEKHIKKERGERARRDVQRLHEQQLRRRVRRPSPMRSIIG